MTSWNSSIPSPMAMAAFAPCRFLAGSFDSGRGPEAGLSPALGECRQNPPADIRWQQRLTNFERALRLLREAMAHGPEALNQLEKEGVIQRFESCFELAWKTVKDSMEASGGTTWMAMLDHRNLLSHTYNPAVFEQAVDAIHQRYLPQPS
jgi:hypothetical protein